MWGDTGGLDTPGLILRTTYQPTKYGIFLAESGLDKMLEKAMYGDSGTVAPLLLRADTIKNGLLPSFQRLSRLNDP
jgi:hypothetical protein